MLTNFKRFMSNSTPKPYPLLNFEKYPKRSVTLITGETGYCSVTTHDFLYRFIEVTEKLSDEQLSLFLRDFHSKALDQNQPILPENLALINRNGLYPDDFKTQRLVLALIQPLCFYRTRRPVQEPFDVASVDKNKPRTQPPM